VKTMLQAHQGNVTILDNQPKGTIFRVNLPT
jgi:K+-sensing histidine kinase KdpD